MAYLEDENLEFLQYCSTEDLQILVDYLTKDKDGQLRVSEELTTKESYKKYYPHSLPIMWKEIAEELQHYGGNTFANTFRGSGVPYREILTDVAKKQKVNFNSDNSVELIEQYILQSIMQKAIEKMSEEELKNFLTEMNAGKMIGTKQAMTVAAFTVIRSLGGFTTYKVAVIVANTVAKTLLGRGLTLAGNAALTRGLSTFLGGPIIWIITGLWTIVDIASPAYRVTIPCVIQVAYMRLKFQEASFKEISKEELNSPDSETFNEVNKEDIQKEGGEVDSFFDNLEVLLKEGKCKEILKVLYQNEEKYQSFGRFKEIEEKALKGLKEN